MQAKANTPYPVRAFTGREYVTYEWRDVPEGYEAQARDNPYLELRETEPALPPRQEGGSQDGPPSIDATDAARALAEEHGIDLTTVEGSGQDGRIVLDDVRALTGE